MKLLYYAALLNFLFDRYTDPSGEYGFAGGWIIGYEANSNRNYNYMGPAPCRLYGFICQSAAYCSYRLRSVFTQTGASMCR